MVFYIGVRSGRFPFIVESRFWVGGTLVDRGKGGEGCRTIRSSLGVPRSASGQRWGPGRNMAAAGRRGGAGWTEKEGGATATGPEALTDPERRGSRVDCKRAWARSGRRWH